MIERNAVLFTATRFSIVVLTLIYFAACGCSDNAEPPPPEVVDCEAIRYDGVTHEIRTGFLGGCSGGLDRFSYTIFHKGTSVCLNIWCTGGIIIGCIDKVALCTSGSVSPMAPSDF